MKQLVSCAKKSAPWLLLLVLVNIFSGLLLWLSDQKAFQALLGVNLLFSLLLFSGVFFTLFLREEKKRSLFEKFLFHPDLMNKQKLLLAVRGPEKKQVEQFCEVLMEKERELRQLRENLLDYEEYVEAWAHEAKTPLSLLTMLLENRADEIPPLLLNRMDYVRSQLQEDVTQMLYYARLKSSTKDYRFEEVKLADAVEEVLVEYGPLLEEKGFLIENHLREECVFTDDRGLQFMLGQILSNSIKYCADDPMLTITLEEKDAGSVLRIADNGIGAKAYDLPYLFQKGFTGDSADCQKKATGMGLYLTKKMAEDLHLELEVTSQWKQGFEVSIQFPRI